jgi:hypothetical protein
MGCGAGVIWFAGLVLAITGIVKFLFPKKYVTTPGNMIDINSLPPNLRNVKKGSPSTKRKVERQPEKNSNKQDTITNEDTRMAGKKKLPMVDDPYLELNLRKVVGQVVHGTEVYKREKRKESENVERKAIKRMKNGKVKNEALLGNVKEKAGSLTRQADGKNNEAKHFVQIDLVSDARKTWQVGYGRQLSPSNVFSDIHPNIGMVWTCALSMQIVQNPFTL